MKGIKGAAGKVLGYVGEVLLLKVVEVLLSGVRCDWG